MPGICLWVWDINAHSDMRAETESRIKTSVRDVPSRVKTSSTQAETPATLNSPLRISTLARVSRNKRLLAIKNTDRGQLFTRPLHSEAVVTNRHLWNYTDRGYNTIQERLYASCRILYSLNYCATAFIRF